MIILKVKQSLSKYLDFLVRPKVAFPCLVECCFFILRKCSNTAIVFISMTYIQQLVTLTAISLAVRCQLTIGINILLMNTFWAMVCWCSTVVVASEWPTPDKVAKLATKVTKNCHARAKH